MKNFEILSNPRKIYRRMLEDISQAKRSIYLETYIYHRDSVGVAFRNALIKKAKEGVKVYVLVDAWGSNVDKRFFRKLIRAGGNIKFFKEFQHVVRFFSKNHERNHRKLLIIDRKITYIGSINITSECLAWRELVLRIRDSIGHHFVESFKSTWNLSGQLTQKRIKRIFHKGFEILQDLPDDLISIARNRYLKLINHSKREILIETPYFIPPLRIRRALARAAKRGVKIQILLPNISDVKLADIMRNRYLGFLYKNNIKISYFMPGVLHSKLLIVDGKYFLLGSSNLDYRSFLQQHEINILGEDKMLAEDLREFFYSGMAKSKPFSYPAWKNRSSLVRIIELILRRIEKYL